ncbi:MAG: hypothetical protein NT149_00610 [Candidatus Gottesmanbacteria bacterium]|nr:hypothetical protein [Candidatus Gottesmanbacteria bacterium]
MAPIGFVSIHQALMYKLKKDEGVPPSVIFLGISHHNVSLSLYKVGVLSGQKTLSYSGDIAIQVEELLKQFKDLEVLPARILLYGHDGKDLGQVKSDLLKYPWTTRVNFLHFPKIEIITPEEVVAAISLAGASELANEMKEEEVSQPEAGRPLAEEPKQEEPIDAEAEAEAEEIEEGENIIQEEEPNVVVVDPSRFGFRKNVDVLEETEQPAPVASPSTHRKPFTIKIQKIDVAALIARFRAGGVLPVIGVVAVVILLGGFIYWAAPHATVTVLESPKSISDSEQIIIDPAATSVDAENKIIPGSKQTLSVSEDKTIAVTGKKNVGDPAKGSVTIYNKTLSGKSLSKGTALTAGSLEFTFDGDTSVASASEDLGGRTYGKVSAAITAAQIGANSNMPTNTTFAIKGFSSDEMTANNPQALTGGTSREVTVVSRADYDALVAAAQKDLVDQAKQGLTASVAGTAKLIGDTIQTTVTQKSFAQELDQEATQLSGKVTVTVSGISYSDDDVKTLLKAFIAKDIPQGFTLSESRTQVSLDKVVVKKNGTIAAVATIKTDAVPTLDIAAIQKNLAGKKISDATAYLRAMPGIAGMEVSVRMSPWKNRLPINAKNISVGLAIQ